MGEQGRKLTSQDTPPAIRKTKGLRNSREEAAHPRWRKEAGGRGKGQTQPQRSHPSHPANRPRLLSKDFLRPDRRHALGPQREKARRTRGECAQASGCLSLSPRKEKARRARREGPQASGCLSRSPRRENARRARGESTQASGCLSHSPRREKVHHAQGEGAQASGCLNR